MNYQLILDIIIFIWLIRLSIISLVHKDVLTSLGDILKLIVKRFNLMGGLDNDNERKI